MKLYTKIVSGIEAGETREGPTTSAQNVNKDIRSFRAQLEHTYTDGHRMPIYLAAKPRRKTRTLGDRWAVDASGFKTRDGFAQPAGNYVSPSVLERFI